MKKINKTRLTINSETVRRLAPLQLARAHGGLPPDTMVDEMCDTTRTFRCPTDNCRSVINSQCKLCQ